MEEKIKNFENFIDKSFDKYINNIEDIFNNEKNVNVKISSIFMDAVRITPTIYNGFRFISKALFNSKKFDFYFKILNKNYKIFNMELNDGSIYFHKKHGYIIDEETIEDMYRFLIKTKNYIRLPEIQYEILKTYIFNLKNNDEFVEYSKYLKL